MESRGGSYTTDWQRKNRPAYHNSQDKFYAKKRGISWDDYLKMSSEQSGVCAICGKPNRMKYRRRLTIDHDHKTNKVRGLLCHHCNMGLGSFGDMPELLEKAASYLAWADYAANFSPVGLGC
jgi:hypothetical protein